MDYDVIVVGAGLAGLTAAAYLAKAGHRTLVCERQAACGGLVNSFERNGFVYDGGIRAMESSGILLPMLKHLGLDVPLVRSSVSMGVEDRLLHVDGPEAVAEYEALLRALYPESGDDIGAIVAQIRRIMTYMEIQYGINNPVFLDIKEDREYFAKAVLPWMVKYALTVGKVEKLKEPVVDYLRRFTQNQSLLDLIAQHFFRATPAYFALSYFSLYLDYYYPVGGTGTFPRKLVELILARGGTIRTDTEIVAVDPARKIVTEAGGATHSYRKLIWAADLKALYRTVDAEALVDERSKAAFELRRQELQDKRGGDSVLTVYLALELDPRSFAERVTGHFFYTPSRLGQSQAGPLPLGQPREAVEAWLRRVLALTTYEISIPVLRDATLAPPGKTGLIVSLLFDYDLTKQIADAGWYDDFKALVETVVVETLDGSVFPGLKAAVLECFSSTPLTLAAAAGTTDGAITGWAFTNPSMPAEHRLLKVAGSVRTPIPDVYQAGQWTFSPSGFPTALLTGKLAADQVHKALG